MRAGHEVLEQTGFLILGEPLEESLGHERHLRGGSLFDFSGEDHDFFLCGLDRQFARGFRDDHTGNDTSILHPQGRDAVVFSHQGARSENVFEPVPEVRALSSGEFRSNLASLSIEFVAGAALVDPD